MSVVRNALLCGALFLLMLPGTATASEQMVDVDGYQLHFVVNAKHSDHTVVLEAGGGADSRSWQAVQTKMANTTGFNVVSYDRAGFGKSTLGPAGLSPQQQIDDLVKALAKLGYSNHLVLVGHSYAGLLDMYFVNRYPAKVDGMLLIDPMNTRFIAKFGMQRLMAKAPTIKDPESNFQKALKRMIETMSALTVALQDKHLPADKPVYLISAGTPPYDDRPQDIRDWHDAHAEMLAGSRQHVLVKAPNNTHDLINENPALVIRTLKRLTANLKAH